MNVNGKSPSGPWLSLKKAEIFSFHIQCCLVISSLLITTLKDGIYETPCYILLGNELNEQTQVTPLQTHLFNLWYSSLTLCLWRVSLDCCCSVAQLCLFVTPWTAACQSSLSLTVSQSLLKLMSIKSVMRSNHLILCHPLLLPSIFPSIKVFSIL